MKAKYKQDPPKKAESHVDRYKAREEMINSAKDPKKERAVRDKLDKAVSMGLGSKKADEFFSAVYKKK